MFTTLLCTKLRTDLVFLCAIGILYVTGVLDAKEAFSGFSSTSVVIIGVLFVVVAGLTYTGVLQWIVKNLLGQPGSYAKAVVRLIDNVPSPLTENEFILGGDHLVYAGQIDEILELKETHGLVSANHHVFSLDELDRNRQLRTAFITFDSRLIGTTIDKSRFEHDTGGCRPSW